MYLLTTLVIINVADKIAKVIPRARGDARNFPMGG